MELEFPRKILAKRIIFATDKDLRYYLMQYIEQEKVLHPHAMHQWKFIPEEWAEVLLFIMS